MKVTDSALNLSSQYQKTELSMQSLSIQYEERVAIVAPQQDEPRETVNISEEAKNLQQSTKIEKEAKLSEKEKLKIALLEKMFSALLGTKIKFNTMDELPTEKEDIAQKIEKEMRGDRGDERIPEFQYRLTIDFKEASYKSENLDFQSSGVVKTADGRTIAFDHKFSFAREEYHETNIHYQEGNWKDPLIVNFNGPSAALSGETFEFDFHSDGSKAKLAKLNEGQGYLAYDKNGNGKIDNGSELFGPQTGQGFAELAQFDDDKNGWIDENDAIFDKLSVWTKDANGNDKLFGLLQKDVGAISLTNVNTQYQLSDNARLRSSSVYLKESGGVGTVQQIDLKF